MELKIGRNSIPIKQGDFITYDGNKYTLLSGDIRPLLIEDNIHHCFLELPITTFNKIPKEILRKKRDIMQWEFK